MRVTVKDLLGSRLILAPTLFALGFAVCALGFGVPAIRDALGTEAAANWASASATLLAAAIALVLGLVPILDAKAVRSSKSQAICYITYATVDTEAGFARAAQILFQRDQDDDHYNAAMGFALRVDRSMFDGLIAALDAVPEPVAVAVSHAIAEIERFRQSTAPKGEPLRAPDDFVRLPPLHQVMEPMVAALLGARSALFLHAAGRLPPSLEEAAAGVATKIHAGLLEVLHEAQAERG